MSFTNGWEGPKPYAMQLAPEPVRLDISVPNPEIGTIPLRPLQLGDILGGTFKAIRFAPLATFGLTLVTMMVAQIIGGLAGYVLDRQSGLSLTPFANSGLADQALLSWTTLASMATTQLTSIVVSMGLIHVVSQSVRATRVTLPEALRHMGRRLLPALGLALLLGAGTALLFAPFVAMLVYATSADASGSSLAIFLLATPVVGGLGAWLGTRVLLATCVVSVEGVGPIKALRRSWSLTTGGFWRILGIYLLSGIIISMASGTVTQVFSFVLMLLALQSPGVGLTLAMMASNLMSLVLTLPLSASVLTMLYVDTRIRREGYDLALSEAMYG